MLLLLFISTLKITLVAEKDTFYVGEQIKVSWKIINEGENEIFIQSGGYEYIGLLSDNCRMWDNKGNEIPHGKGAFSIVLKQGEKYHIPVKPLSPNKTISQGPINLLESFHTNKDWHGILDFYLSEGEYYYCLYYLVKEGEKYRKVYSDTFHFWVIFPTGEDREAFKMYREFSKNFWDKIEYRPKAFKYGYKILKRYPNSVYVKNILYNMNSFLKMNIKYSPGTEGVKRAVERMTPIIKDICHLFEKSLPEKNQTPALHCIVYGELNLGKTKEEVKEIVKKLNVKTDKEINTLLGIQEK